MATLSGTSSEDDVSYNKRKFRDFDENETTLDPKKMRADSSSTGSAGSDEEEFARPSFGFSMGPSAEISSPANMVASDFIVSSSKVKEVNYSDKAAKMMAKMGYKKGAGLGRFEQGIVKPIESSKQKGKRGLGMTLRGFEQSDVEWRFDRETISADETIEWLPSCQEAPPNLEEMINNWMKTGPVKMAIADEAEFCNQKVLANVLSCKDIFDNLESEEMRKARTKSNPFETIRGAFFLNRAAMKMANMDSVADFMFTQPCDDQGKSLIQPGELLYFGDLCAGPGGFSEYVLWRRKCDTKGFGFTLRGACDFKLEEFFAAPSEYFEPHYGVNDDGDIYNPENLREFQKFVFDNTENRGLHFVMADGGFSVDGQENLQEILSKRLYLCQFLCALSVLREGGSFVCKLFDLFTPFSVGLVYLMYRAFRTVSIFKPVTSRPANSERYIICKGKRTDAGVVHDYMFEINLQLERLGSFNNETVSQCVPLEVIKGDDTFYEYIVNSNNSIGIQQSIALSKIQTFAKNNDLMEERQTEMRNECLKRWGVPDQVRTAPDRSVPAHIKFAKLLGIKDTHSSELDYKESPEELTATSLQNIRSVYNYRCVIAGSKDMSSGAVADRWFLLGLGKSFVFKWNGHPSSKWTKEDQMVIELPLDTILEVEFVQELRGEAKAQRRVTCVHVIDAMFLGGIDVRSLHFMERHEKIRRFVKAITRSTRKDLAPIRVKDVYRLEEIANVFDRLAMKKMKGGGGRHKLCYCGVQDDCYIVPSGMYLMKTVQDPWSIQFSRSQKRKYFFNNAKNESVFECPKESIASFRSCLKHRLLWSWSEVKVHDLQEDKSDPIKVSRDAMIKFIEQRTGLHK